MATDRLGAFLKEKTPRRLIAFGVFIGLIYLFRELFPLLVFFVAFERSLSAGSAFLMKKAKVSQRFALFTLGTSTATGVVVLVVSGARWLAHNAQFYRDQMPAPIAAWNKPAYRKFLSPEELRARREAAARGEPADVVPLKVDPHQSGETSADLSQGDGRPREDRP